MPRNSASATCSWLLAFRTLSASSMGARGRNGHMSGVRIATAAKAVASTAAAAVPSRWKRIGAGDGVARGAVMVCAGVRVLALQGPVPTRSPDGQGGTDALMPPGLQKEGDLRNPWREFCPRIAVEQVRRGVPGTKKNGRNTAMASMTGIERAAVINRVRPTVAPPTRGRPSTMRRGEPSRSIHKIHQRPCPGLAGVVHRAG
jgi:hypothetical protein